MTPFFLSALKQNLSRLCAIRCILLAVQCAAISYAYAIGLSLAYAPILFTQLLGLTIIVLSFWRAHPATPWPVTEVEFLCHLLVDSILLCLMLYLTGGASNPLVSLLLIPLTISAALLPPGNTRVITMFSLLSYTTLLFYHIPVDILSTHHTPSGISPHIAGMWFTFVLSALLITYFITQMAKTLRRQEKHLQQNREDTLRDEQVLAVASLAAGAAHDLGTPLSTMRVLLTELESETSGDKSLNEDIKLLGTQVERCKTSLQSLVDTAQDQMANEEVVIQTPDFIEQLLDSWRSLRPEVKLVVDIAADVSGTSVQNTPSLAQALMNLFDNAAKVSDLIEIAITQDCRELRIIIRDHGPGVSEELLNQIGHSLLQQSEHGLGLGLLLTHATIERIGGSIQLENHPDGGSLTQVRVPLYLASTT